MLPYTIWLKSGQCVSVKLDDIAKVDEFINKVSTLPDGLSIVKDAQAGGRVQIAVRRSEISAIVYDGP